MSIIARTSAINLDQLCVDDLVALSTRLDAQQTASRKTLTALAQLVDQIHARCDAIGVAVQDVIAALQEPKRGAAKCKTAKGSTVAAMCRGPEGQSRSARGRTHAWLRELDEKGRARDKFKI